MLLHVSSENKMSIVIFINYFLVCVCVHAGKREKALLVVYLHILGILNEYKKTNCRHFWLLAQKYFK